MEAKITKHNCTNNNIDMSIIKTVNKVFKVVSNCLEATLFVSAIPQVVKPEIRKLQLQLMYKL